MDLHELGTYDNNRWRDIFEQQDLAAHQRANEERYWTPQRDFVVIDPLPKGVPHTPSTTQISIAEKIGYQPKSVSQSLWSYWMSQLFG